MPLGLYNIKAYSVLAANAAAISLHVAEHSQDYSAWFTYD